MQKALDALGAALDQALQLLEKGLAAVIDAASAVVQGAIQVAQAVVEALGTWAKLLANLAELAGPKSPAAMKGDDQRQCRSCEAKHAAYTLVQRLDQAVASPGSTDDEVGKQAGGKGLSKTEAIELTRQHLHQHVYPHITAKLRQAVLWPANWSRPGERDEAVASFIRAINRILWPMIR